MHTQLDISPTGRRVDHRRHLLSSAHAQMMSLRASPEGTSTDRRMLANALQLQNALLRKDLTAEMAQELLKNQRPSPPAQDFSSIEQRIADTCGIDPEHPYGR